MINVTGIFNLKRSWLHNFPSSCGIGGGDFGERQ